MKKNYILLLLSLVLSVSLMAVKKVAYITFQKTMYVYTDTKPTSPAAATVQTDPIYLMLNADSNLQVTLKVLTTVAATDVISDLADYDVIIVQESFSGNAGILTPAGALALKTIPKPFIYNKTYALQKTRALSLSTSTGAGKEADGTLANGTLLINVESTALTNDLFKACTLVNTNQIQLFNALTTDAGELGATTSVKAINYNSGIATLTGSTLLAQPAVLQASTTAGICINSFTTGASIEGEITIAPSIFVGMNFGAICANNGTNITSDALTIWRNAVYILAGLPVPSTKVITAVNTPSISSEVMSVKYYSTSGIEIKDPSTGIFITKTAYKNGIVKTGKVVLVNHTNY
ncbi:MAG: hypothetical protein ACYC25_02160 [Paludibacter sp.]